MNPVEEIYQAEQTLYKAQLAGDVAILDTLLADDLLFVGPDGQLYTKEMDLEAHRSRTMSITTLISHEPIIQLMPHTAIVTVMIELQGVFAGQPAGGKFRYLRVWTKQQDTWKITAGSCTPVQE
ncbi:nuclear transport factor 2 family protein [Runella sp.]|uniref:nuclear transport factor 2 family protein n=1 Tax=Runella sp. TaxID=1960881 RepID=UPI003D118BE8